MVAQLEKLIVSREIEILSKMIICSRKDEYLPGYTGDIACI